MNTVFPQAELWIIYRYGHTRGEAIGFWFVPTGCHLPNFTTSESTLILGINRHERNAKHAIILAVNMKNGNLRDLLTLAMKGALFMEGRIDLNTKIGIPPLAGTVRQKLLLDGKFTVSQARFLRSRIQEQINTFSHRGQGKPHEEETVKVPSGLAGTFRLAKRWALKPVDPFFSKQGGGSLLHIQVTGTSRNSQFGLDHNRKQAHVSK